MFRSIQTFSVNSKFTECYHIFCARIDLFTIFIRSRYRLWATIRLLHHFGFVMCIKTRLYCMHFSCHWRKIHNVSWQLTQISKRQCNPLLLEMVLERPAQTVTRQGDNFHLWTIMSAAWKGGLPSKSVHVLCHPFQISIIFNSVGCCCWGFLGVGWGGVIIVQHKKHETSFGSKMFVINTWERKHCITLVLFPTHSLFFPAMSKKH